MTRHSGEYTGHVKPGGAAASHELSHLIITKVSVGPMDNNAYLLRCRRTDEQVLIDAANDAPVLLRLIGDGGLAKVVTTHQHPDHWQALAEVTMATGATTVAGADDAEGIPVPTDTEVRDGDTVTVGDCELEVIQLVGHTPGSIALLYDDPTGAPARLHRRLPLPRRRRQHARQCRGLRLPARRRRAQAVRPPPGRDLDLPRPRRRHHPRHRTPGPPRLAHPRLVTPWLASEQLAERFTSSSDVRAGRSTRARPGVPMNWQSTRS